MSIERQLYISAAQLIEDRYPKGWGGAAAMRMEDGSIVTSIAPDIINDAANLCMETVSIIEAHERKQKVTHSHCIVR
nr:hypothetical protein [Halobacillus litoralis]